jgi:Mg2+/Co2+ transporter CorB
MEEIMEFNNLELWMYLGAIFILILLSAFFSGSETALTAISKAKMHNLAKDGNKRAKAVNKLTDKKDKMLGGLLLGNNIVNILSAALATSLLTGLFGASGVALATLVMTLLILVFAEVLPKTYAMYHHDKMALSIVHIITLIVKILAPITTGILIVVKFILRIFGVKIEKLAVSSEEELRGAIDLHQGQEGDDEEDTKEERAMLKSILDLDEVDVEAVMTHRKKVFMLDIDQPIEKLIEKISNSEFSRIPLYQDKTENIVGIVHIKDILRISNKDSHLTILDLQEILSEPWFIPETTTLFDQLQAFRERHEHFASVVDEYGEFQGIITLEDVLEEIVGEISDEHDKEEKEIIAQKDGSFTVDGTTTIRDLNRIHEWDLPDEDYSTIAGLILYETGAIPEKGQIFSFYGFTFEILKKNKNQITSVKVSNKK